MAVTVSKVQGNALPTSIDAKLDDSTSKIRTSSIRRPQLPGLELLNDTGTTYWTISFLVTSTA